MTYDYDYLIVGQGLAGSMLAHLLMERGKRVLVFDQADKNISSSVAAGLYNPITGRKMVKTWKADALFKNLKPFYENLESILRSRFFHEKTIYRPFYNIEQQNEWMGRSADEGYSTYLKEVHRTSAYGREVFDDYGGLSLSRCGYVDIPVLMESFRHHLRSRDSYRSERFLSEKMDLRKEGVTYEGIKVRKAIFCDGYCCHDNPYFSWLPFRWVKGEVLWVETDEVLDRIYNRGVFVLPVKGRYCRVGATYDHHDLSIQISEKARSKLEATLGTLLRIGYRVVGQVAGIRPATKDRRPLLGVHPDYDNLLIFNGLGAKGVSLAPYFAEQMVALLEEGREPDREVNISRFF